MARINFPTRFMDSVNLGKDVRAKHNVDDTASVLIPFLTSEVIDLADDDTDSLAAVVAHNSAKQAERNAEKLNSQRDKHLKDTFADHKKCVQFLKKFNRSNINILGDWGVTVVNNSRIEYPTDFVQLTSAITNFIAKHGTFTGTTSPLHAFLIENKIDLTVNQNRIDAAIENHNDAITQSNSSETLGATRDDLFDPVYANVRKIGAFLMALYVNNPHKAGDWGYAIDDSPKGAKEKTVVIKEAEVKIIRNGLLNSVITNTGTIPLEIFAGDTQADLPIALPAGESFKLSRGFATFTAKNNSTSTKGKLLATVYK